MTANNTPASPEPAAAPSLTAARLDELHIGVVAEAFLERSLTEMLDWLVQEAPEVTEVEIGSGGYAPHPHCDVSALLSDRTARSRWLDKFETRGLHVSALNCWGNQLHPDPELSRQHDQDLRDTIRLAAELGVDRVLALAGCPGAGPEDRVAPHFSAGGWLPYLEGIWERQWEEVVAPYWRALSEFARREHPSLLICLELHPGTAVYNVDTFSQLQQLGDNLAANLDPSHFMWQHADPLAIARRLGGRIGYVHAKDVRFIPENLALNGVMDRRWPNPPDRMPWNFATLGTGRDAGWWHEFVATTALYTSARTISIEHEDPFTPPAQGVPPSARLLAGAISDLRNETGVAR